MTMQERSAVSSASVSNPCSAASRSLDWKNRSPQVYPLTDSYKWYFDIVFWDTDFEFYRGWPQKHRVAVTDFEITKFTLEGDFVLP